jgi:hypothetical protein
VTLLATFVALSYALTVFGRTGYYVLPIAYAAMLVFYDVRTQIVWRTSVGTTPGEKPLP